MILHIFNKQEKFSVQYVKFLKDSGFDMDDHFIFHYGKQSDYFIKENINSMFSGFASIKKHLALYKIMKEADKILIHSLASPFLLLLLMFKFKVSEKFYWIIWGKDLYFRKCVNMKNPVNLAYELLRVLAIKNVKHIITNIEGDYELAKRWYKTNAIWHKLKGVGYPYNSDVKERDLQYNKDLSKVLLGNSASKSNNHIEALDRLKAIDDGKMEIVVPLSYGGSKKYAEKVAEYGKSLFGDRLVPLIDFLPLDEYNKLIGSIDIAYFNHKRQEALSNLFTLLSQGKKVYIRKESSLWGYFKDKGIVVHNSKSLDDFFEADNKEIVMANYKAVLDTCDLKLAKESWKEIFDLYEKN